MNDYVGKVFRSNKYGDVIVTKYDSYKEVHIRFLDSGYETKKSLPDIKRGFIKDMSAPTVVGVGILEVEDIRVNGKTSREYNIWYSMLHRCYSEKRYEKNPTYVDCYVSERFKYFSNFREWYYLQIGHDNEGWELDKDILVKHNKCYSEDTCVFVPRELNSILVKSDKIRGDLPIGVSHHKSHKTYAANIKYNGKTVYLGSYLRPEEAFLSYKEAKENHIKDLANKWKDKVDPRVYEVLMKYQVEITD